MSVAAVDGPALLLMGCSRRKSPRLRRGPAWDLYDGPLFQVLKKALRDRPGWEADVAILIVSARHGVIDAGRVIATYDERLTAELSRRRGDPWARQLRAAVAGRSFRAVHVNLGRDYLGVLPDLGELFGTIPLERAVGGIGSRNAQTRRWVLGQLGLPAGPVSGGTARRRSPRR